jgi:hypothetical protein
MRPTLPSQLNQIHILDHVFKPEIHFKAILPSTPEFFPLDFRQLILKMLLAVAWKVKPDLWVICFLSPKYQLFSEEGFTCSIHSSFTSCCSTARRQVLRNRMLSHLTVISQHSCTITGSWTSCNFKIDNCKH